MITLINAGATIPEDAEGHCATLFSKPGVASAQKNSCEVLRLHTKQPLDESVLRIIFPVQGEPDGPKFYDDDGNEVVLSSNEMIERVQHFVLRSMTGGVMTRWSLIDQRGYPTKEVEFVKKRVNGDVWKKGVERATRKRDHRVGWIPTWKWTDLDDHPL